jgi:hypothetical protein
MNGYTKNNAIMIIKICDPNYARRLMNVITDNSDTSDSKAPKITISWISLGVRIGSLVVDSYFILPAHSEEHIFNTLVVLSMLMLPLEA